MPKLGSRSFLRSPTVHTFIAAVRLDDSPTFYNSAALDVSAFRRFLLYVSIDSTSTPTDVQLIVQFSDDAGTTWWTYKQGLFASLFWEDQDTATAINECFGGEVEGRLMRIRAVATGSTAAAYFDVTAKAEFYAD